VFIFVLQIAGLVHIIYGHGTHTHQIIWFMAVDMDSVYVFNLFWRSVLYFYVRMCHQLLYRHSPVISISPTLNFHEVKTRTYLFIPMYALGRFTPLSLHFISPGGRPYACIFHIKLLRHLHLRKNTDYCMHMQMHFCKFRVCSFGLIIRENMWNIRSHCSNCSLLMSVH